MAEARCNNCHRDIDPEAHSPVECRDALKRMAVDLAEGELAVLGAVYCWEEGLSTAEEAMQMIRAAVLPNGWDAVPQTAAGGRGHG
jgi:hypothetical protein